MNSETSVNRFVLDEKIASAAYNLWLREGRPLGRHQEYWLRAERQLRKEQESPTRKAKPARSATVDTASERM